MATLYLDISEGDFIHVGGATLMMEHKGGKKARFCINAEKSVNIQLVKNPDPNGNVLPNGTLRQRTSPNYLPKHLRKGDE